MGGIGGPLRAVVGTLHPVRHRLLPWVLVAAFVGVLLPRSTSALNPLVPVFLAGQVLGVALNLTPFEVRAAGRQLPLIGAALLCQWTLLPAFGLALHLLAPTPVLAAGILICSIAPAEITSGLMATLAGGDTAIATACMAGSLALSVALTPLWLEVGLGARAHFDAMSLTFELVLSVLLPLVVGVSLRAVLPGLARWRHQFLDLSAFCLVLVVLAGTASARQVLLSSSILVALGLVIGLLCWGGVVGFGLGRVLRLPHRRAAAVGFPIGIREFGVAIAVSVAVRPGASAVGGVYGIVMVAVAGTLASHLGRRRERMLKGDRGSGGQQ
ncbi:MAG: bile acid:sodium symporter [Candidatus Dormibacteraeota bacterium]|nr:bile acid:sodium symporter [Candidatus Dormibacteraeota bacterium]